MATQLSMTYADMQAEIKKLENYMKTFESTTTSMTTSVNSLCDNWKADASPVYKADYNKLYKNFDKTRLVVIDLIKSTKQYISDMQTLDSNYSKSKVN